MKKEYGMHSSATKRFFVALVSLAVMMVMTSAVVQGQQVNQSPIETDKQRLLRALSPAEDYLPPLVLHPSEPVAWAVPGSEIDPRKDGDTARTNGDTFSFKGTGNFYSLKISISTRTSRPHVGYIVQSLESEYQDMVILDDLSVLAPQTHEIAAACADSEKSSPRSDLNMASTPWTEDSTTHWAYWVRQTAIRGRSNGSSRSQIQDAIWYITDRQGSYGNFPLLSAVGYDRNGPTKNIIDDGGGGGDCFPLCGIINLCPATVMGVIGMICMKRRCRRRGSVLTSVSFSGPFEQQT